MASTVVNSPTLLKSVISQLANKIKSEMTVISSDAHDLILKDSVEAMKVFSWETVSLELVQKVATLMSLLSQIVPNVPRNKCLMSFLASQILKSRHQHPCLVQCALSVIWYSNGTNYLCS